MSSDTFSCKLSSTDRVSALMKAHERCRAYFGDTPYEITRLETETQLFATGGVAFYRTEVEARSLVSVGSKDIVWTQDGRRHELIPTMSVLVFPEMIDYLERRLGSRPVKIALNYDDNVVWTMADES